jgi:hypothetical protein
MATSLAATRIPGAVAAGSTSGAPAGTIRVTGANRATAPAASQAAAAVAKSVVAMSDVAAMTAAVRVEGVVCNRAPVGAAAAREDLAANASGR